MIPLYFVSDIKNCLVFLVHSLPAVFLPAFTHPEQCPTDWNWEHNPLSLDLFQSSLICGHSQTSGFLINIQTSCSAPLLDPPFMVFFQLFLAFLRFVVGWDTFIPSEDYSYSGSVHPLFVLSATRNGTRNTSFNNQFLLLGFDWRSLWNVEPKCFADVETLF